MNPTYIIYLLSFLAFPILGIIISKYLDIDSSKKYVLWFILLFAIHNLLFFFGLSIKGDYADYFIFSLEYLLFCIITSLLYKSTNIYARVFRVIGTVLILVGFIQGLIGTLLFIVIAQDYEADKIYNFSSSKKTYQTRRYNFGFATLDNTRYTFETYRTYQYFPFEKQIDKTDFFSLKSNLNFGDDHFSVKIDETGEDRILEFSSSNAEKFVKRID